MSIYGALMAHALHQDALIWSRVQILIAVQSAMITGSYLLRRCWLGPLIAFAGVLLTLFIWLLVKCDKQDRDLNLKLMDELAKAEICEEVATRAGLPSQNDEEKLYVRISAPKIGWRKRIRGTRILYGVIICFGIADLALGFSYIFLPGIFPLG